MHPHRIAVAVLIAVLAACDRPTAAPATPAAGSPVSSDGTATAAPALPPEPPAAADSLPPVPIPATPPASESSDATEAPDDILGASAQIASLLALAAQKRDAGDLEGALARVDEALGILDDDPPALAMRIDLLRRLRRYDDALATAARAKELVPRAIGVLEAAVAVWIESGRDAEGLASLEGWKFSGKNRIEAEFLRATLEARSGNSEAALDSLARAAARGFADKSKLVGNADFKALFASPRFPALLGRVDRNAEVAAEPVPIELPPEHRQLRYSPPELISELQRRAAKGGGTKIELAFDSFGGIRYDSRQHHHEYQIAWFWAHWSARSTAMLPAVVELRERLLPRGVRVLIIAVDLYAIGADFVTTTSRWLADNRPDAFAPETGTLDKSTFLGIDSTGFVPATAFVDVGSELLMVAPGELDLETLTELAEAMVEGSETRRASASTDSGDSRP